MSFLDTLKTKVASAMPKSGALKTTGLVVGAAVGVTAYVALAAVASALVNDLGETILEQL